jgi:heme-degrading monooxygenase HmoA
MIKVIYTWSVKQAKRAIFFETWRQTTRHIHKTTKGAQGSFCLSATHNPSHILTVAHWESVGDWRLFIESAPSTNMKELHEIGELISVEPFFLIGDETRYDVVCERRRKSSPL